MIPKLREFLISNWHRVTDYDNPPKRAVVEQRAAAKFARLKRDGRKNRAGGATPQGMALWEKFHGPAGVTATIPPALAIISTQPTPPR